MKEIVSRLHENRQIELAKEILEANGYKVTKKLREDSEFDSSDMREYMTSISELLDNYGGEEAFAYDRGGTEELDIPCKMLGGSYSNVYLISDEDDGSEEVFEFIEEIEGKKEITREDIPDGGYCILMDSSIGKYVYQNIAGMITIFMKF